jgi:hypothetical protein
MVEGIDFSLKTGKIFFTGFSSHFFFHSFAAHNTKMILFSLISKVSDQYHSLLFITNTKL